MGNLTGVVLEPRVLQAGKNIRLAYNELRDKCKKSNNLGFVSSFVLFCYELAQIGYKSGNPSGLLI